MPAKAKAPSRNPLDDTGALDYFTRGAEPVTDYVIEPVSDPVIPAHQRRKRAPTRKPVMVRWRPGVEAALLAYCAHYDLTKGAVSEDFVIAGLRAAGWPVPEGED